MHNYRIDYRDIIIVALILFVLVLGVAALPAQQIETSAIVQLAWNAQPDEPGLAGYRVHLGFETGNYIDVRDCAEADVEQDFVVLPQDGSDPQVTIRLEPGRTYFCSVTAVNTFGLESDYSNEISFTTPTRPGAPSNLRVLEMSISDNLTSWVPSHYFSVAANDARQFYKLEIK